MAGPSGFHRRVVVKVVRDAENAGLEEALLDEARLTATLVHRNIVPVIGLEDAGGEKIMVLEYVDGLDLFHLLGQRPKLKWALAVHIAAEVALGLDYAHRHTDPAGRPLGIVHRDVSPPNILLSWEGEVKLADFGVAKARRSTESLGGLKGNVPYMAPEQAKGIGVDARADIFSLGVVLFECVSGKNPFRARSQLETLSNVRDHRLPRLEGAPSALCNIVERATERDPAKRFQTAAELRQALLQISGQPLDPSGDLATYLGALRRASATGSDVFYDAVLGGGGRPLTRLALKTVYRLRKRPIWAIVLAAALAFGLMVGILRVRHKEAPLVARPSPTASPSTGPLNASPIPLVNPKSVSRAR